MAYNSPKKVYRGDGQVTVHHPEMNQRQGKDKDTASGWMSSTADTNKMAQIEAQQAQDPSVLNGLRTNSRMRRI